MTGRTPSPRRILIVRLSAIGDTALTTPLFAMLRVELPDAFIGWVVNEVPSGLLRGLAGLDRLHVLKRSGGRIAAVRSVVREIRTERYDVALDAQGLTKSAMLPFLAGIPLRVGLAPGRVEGREISRFLNNRIVRPPARLRHIVARTLWLCTALGPPFGDDMPEDFPVRLPVAADALAKTLAWWKERGLSGRTVVFGVGAGWPTKVWPVERVACLARAARARGMRSVFQWGPSERAQLPRWREALPEDAVIAPEMSVRELVATLSLAGRYAGPDSAALHLAALLGKPTFSWFGASDPERCAPRGQATPGGPDAARPRGDVHVHVDAGVDCAPCWKRKCESPKCITGLREEEVLPAFEAWLDA
jgi:ADP-heptose:LPS heptosyltransferase